MKRTSSSINHEATFVPPEFVDVVNNTMPKRNVKKKSLPGILMLDTLQKSDEGQR